LGKRVLVKKGHEFEPGVMTRTFDWGFRYYELVVRLSPESYIYINVLDKTGKSRTLVYSSAAIPGLNKYGEFVVPLDAGVSDGTWHSLIIDLPQHMEQARWPGFAQVNWLSLRGAVTLAGIRGCVDNTPLIESTIVTPPYVVSREAKPIPSPELSGQMIKQRLESAYALLIGISDYHHMRSLNKTTTDARDLHDLLAQSGYLAANLALLLDGQATKAGISEKLDWLARRAGPDDTVLIFFSSHGAQRIGGFEPGEYLCPVGADWYNLRTTAISDEEFTTALGAIPARRLVVFLDACHSGGVGEPKDVGVMVKTGLSEAAYERLAAGEGRVVIASCKPDEVSWELAGMRNSLFTHYLLEGLRGAAADSEGAVRVFNLFDYVSRQVPQHKSQHPLLKCETDLNFAVALTPQAGAEGEGATASSQELWMYDFFEHFVEPDPDKMRPNEDIYVHERLISGGVAKPGIFQHPPPHGSSRLPYGPIRIPDHIRELKLNFFIAILDERPGGGRQKKFSDRPFEGDALKFGVRINNKRVELLNSLLNSVGWVHHSLLIEPTGDRLTVEFITDAMGDHTYNWAVWGEPRLVEVRAAQEAG
jgi:hypothetical protein